ncbi:unnamed protein product, partial [Ixodes persulcatus]
NKGICIGSSLAPKLSEVYLAPLDVALGQAGSVLLARYVDDILICSDVTDALQKVKDFRVQATPELTFSSEEPEEGVLQYLDLRLNTLDVFFWEYGKLAVKHLFPFKSCHSKLVTRIVVMSLLDNALKTSCRHKVQEAVRRQLGRVKGAGYKSNIVERVERQLRANSKTKEKDADKKPLAVIPYKRNVSHRLKRIAETHEVKVTLSALFKLKGLCKKVNIEEGDPTGHSSCPVQHKCKFVECVEGVVNKIPLTYGKSYMGQTGRCLNERPPEH